MKNYTHKIKDELFTIAIFVAFIWGIFFLDQFLPIERLGLIPRNIGGLTGIISMPFLHGNLSHLMSNTLPLIILLALLAGSRADSKSIVSLIIVLGGVLLWLFGRGDSIHIGASLLVFGLVSFLIVSGLIEKRILPLAISILVAFIYGGTLLSGVLPWQPGVSWDGHLFGAVAGASVAYGLVKRSYTPRG
jgi:membrane associated rhomboid family serine protease